MTHIFISHASEDDGFVKELRAALESRKLPVWVDSRNMRGGDKLAPDINKAIKQARQVIVVLSPKTVNSPWVRTEVTRALKVERKKQNSGYRVIPLLLPGIGPKALGNWFDEEPLGAPVQLETGGLSKALPQILAALGERVADDKHPAPEPKARPVAELKLKLKGAGLKKLGEAKWRVSATAQLTYDPANDTRPQAESSEFKFSAPLGPIEADDLRWYLEEYYRWPMTFFAERAKRIEEQLPLWGRGLYDAATKAKSARDLLADWRQSADGIDRRFSILVDARLPEGTNESRQAAAAEAASALLALPWELMHDGGGFLFQWNNPVRVRRCLPKSHTEKAVASSLPIRILLVSPRPEDDRADYIDHRISARPMVEAVESLGELAELTVLDPPTFPAFGEALRLASEAERRFDVIHFDGHGVYDRQRGLGALCFEDPKDHAKLEKRACQLIDAEELGALVREHRIPLVFLEACQSAAEARPAASVAAKLLDAGVTSVVAMTHSVLVETARRFVTAFYGELAGGSRIGSAMLAGQNALYGDDFRGQIMGAGELRLKDWFVPVLYQEENDPQLVTRLTPDEVKALHDQRRRLSLGELPPPPAHTFVGRSRDLLKLERMLASTEQGFAVVRGRGGEGKTTLAVELARWLVQTRRFERAAFVSLELYTDARGVLDGLGRQLLPEGDNWSVAQFSDLKQARLEVERALRDHPTIILLDNMESVLPDPATDGGGRDDATTKEIEDIFDLCNALLSAAPPTRLIFTSREPMPEPFAHHHRTAELRELDPPDAIELVGQVLKRAGLEPRPDDAGNTPQEVTDLVEAVGCHARALTLLAREIAIRGVSATTGSVQKLMAELDRKHPGDRENSLYASVELSLRRLPPQMQQQVKGLAVFHGGANLGTLAHVLGVDERTADDISQALVEVGLAEQMPYGHLRLDPALPPYLLRGLSEEEQQTARSRWAEAMQALTGFLYEQRFQDIALSARLTLLELPNLVALLDLIEGHATPEAVVYLAGRVETLLTTLGRPQVLARAARAREQAALHLGQGSGWGHAHSTAEFQKIDRLLEDGRFPEAYQAAQQLLQQSLAAGQTAYPEAGYDIASAHWLLGRVLQMGGDPEGALALLAEAQHRFQALADGGNAYAAGMASVAITETADCLIYLGRLDEAAAAYQEAIARDQKRDDRRGVAVGKGNLGTVRILQRRYQEALEACREALTIFENLGEPRNVAVAWHQMGVVYRYAGQFEQAESAYRQSLAMKVREKDFPGEASSLGELGNLYGSMGRLEEAVKCHRQASDIYVTLQDQRYEGVSRHNLANTLAKLERYDEARGELLRAIECNEPYGHAAQPWMTWNNLHSLEQTIGNPQAAAEARQQAIQSYLAYRRDGGQSFDAGAQACADVAEAIQNGAMSAATAAQELAEYLETETDPRATPLLPKLLAILGGARDQALADDPALYYQDAAELRFLLESLPAN
jgi:tetratricopeptide (TPR) repeat protein